MIKLILIFLLFTSVSHADTLTIPTIYGSTGQVTSANLNGNFQGIATKINGQLDNTNINISLGVRLYDVLATLPSVGTQGRAVFLTSDNTWNIDTGSAFVKMGSQKYYDYGSSQSAYTQYDYSSAKIAYGQAVSVATNSSAVITNLPFTGFTTYRCSVSASTSSTTNISPPVYVGNTGSQMTVYNTDDSSTLSIMWICVGT